MSYRGRQITGQRLRGLLALLAGDLRTGCSVARLVDGLWPDEQPGKPTKALQVLVSRARAQLGSGVIASTALGYRLALAEDQIDSSVVLLRAAASARQLRAGDLAAALVHAEAGLTVWGGAPPPSDGVGADDAVQALRAERRAVYRSLERARTLALARLGRHGEAVDPLAALASTLPRDEEVLLELLRCEAATVGPSAALARYEAYRRSLRDELGTGPGAVREFSAAQLAMTGEGDRAGGAFLTWARGFGLAHSEAALGVDPSRTVERIRAERDNLLHALRQAVALADGATAAATIAALAGLWLIESDYARMMALTAESGWVLSHYRPGPDSVEVTPMAAHRVRRPAHVMPAHPHVAGLGAD